MGNIHLIISTNLFQTMPHRSMNSAIGNAPQGLRFSAVPVDDVKPATTSFPVDVCSPFYEEVDVGPNGIDAECSQCIVPLRKIGQLKATSLNTLKQHVGKLVCDVPSNVTVGPCRGDEKACPSTDSVTVDFANAGGCWLLDDDHMGGDVQKGGYPSFCVAWDSNGAHFACGKPEGTYGISGCTPNQVEYHVDECKPNETGLWLNDECTDICAPEYNPSVHKKQPEWPQSYPCFDTPPSGPTHMCGANKMFGYPCMYSISLCSRADKVSAYYCDQAAEWCKSAAKRDEACTAEGLKAGCVDPSIAEEMCDSGYLVFNK